MRKQVREITLKGVAAATANYDTQSELLKLENHEVADKISHLGHTIN